MKLTITCIALCLLSAHFLYGQTNEDKNSPYTFSGKIGIGRTKFDVKGFLTEDYPALVVRLGGGISRPIIGRRLLLVSGLNIYYRAKSKSPLKDEIYYYGKGSLLPRLDDTASKKTHLAFEIPLSIRYLLNGGRSMSAGLIVRNWGPTDLAGDLLKSMTEFGYIVMVNQRIFTDFTVGLDFYWGLSDLYLGSVLGAGGINIKNRAVQVSLGYTFKNR